MLIEEMVVLVRKTILITLFFIASSILTGCVAATMDKLNNVGKEPEIEQLVLPAVKDDYQPVEWPEEDYDEDEDNEKSYANSLWQQGARTFFKDRKARRVGDILTVIVKISDKAELDNETTRNRTNSDNTAVNSALGLAELATGWLPGKAVPSALIDTDSTTNTSGTGAIAREEIIETQVAAMVTQILPNGNLVIRGDQEIRVNFEVRKISVEGIVRPQDINAANAVESNQIAQARISYGGKGQLSDIQQPRIGNQVIDILSPF